MHRLPSSFKVLACSTLALLSLVGRGAVPDTSVIKRMVVEQEMDLHRDGSHATWSTFNRALGLQHSLYNGRLKISGTIADQAWEQHLDPVSIARGTISSPWKPSAVRSSAREVVWSGRGFDVQYMHSQEGLRQNFIVHKRLEGSGPLLVILSSTGDLTPQQVSDGSIAFHTAAGPAAFVYRDLACWDATGKPLTAFMGVQPGKEGDGVTITVDDTLAIYPITVDPVSTTASPLIISPLNNADFGVSVATAGDLNGDGYSDMVIGAWTASLGQNLEGVAYVYYGSITGINVVPSLTLQVDQAGALFGCSASTAGDVNGDGFSDLIVGARAWESNAVTEISEGAAFVYYGSATGITPLPNLTLQMNHADDNYGARVVCLGDINNDGFSDVGISAYLAAYPSFQEGAVFIHRGSATGLNPLATHRLERNQGGSQFGQGISCAGDINADGFSDVVIGAYNWTVAPGSDQGAAFIYYGSAANLGAGFNPAPAQTYLGTATVNNNSTGWGVCGAGDVNGDGYSDVAISAYLDQNGQVDEGLVRIYHGSASGLAVVPTTVLESNLANSWLGYWVCTAGDTNGDGYADLIVGAPYFAGPESQEGRASLYFGSATGIPTTASATFELNTPGAFLGQCVATIGDVNGDGFSDFAAGAVKYGAGGAVAVYLGGGYAMRIASSASTTGGALNAAMGTTVANAGDVNGDGYADALVGIPNASNGQAGEGLVQFRLGSTNGLTAAPTSTLEANLAGARFGASACSAGDVNGDGYADVIVGAPLAGGTGRVFVYHGSPGGLAAAPTITLTGPAASRFGASVSAAGDVNSDGYADVIIGAPDANQAFVYMGSVAGVISPPHVILSEGAPALFGHAVGTAGDVNGDGFSDVIVGAIGYSNGQANEGAAYVYHGSLTGIVLPFAQRMESNVSNARSGFSVAGAGDVNGDGFFDVIVGADQWASGQANEGAAFIFHGSAAGVGAVPVTTLQRNLVGLFFGRSLAEAGDVNGDGYADVVIGAAGYENPAAQIDEGAFYVFRGSTAGIGAAAFDLIEANVAGEQLGTSVSGGGDIDGDGYSDVIAGAPFASPAFANEGRWQWHRGGRGYGLNQLSRQYMADLVSPLATNCMDFAVPTFFGIGHRARSPIQRTDGKVRWEVVFEGQAFTGVPITNSVGNTGISAAWTDLLPGGVEIKELVFKTPGYIRYKWRVRVEYELSKMFDGQRYSRWFYGYASGLGDIGVLPVELVRFIGRTEPLTNVLEWTTASEHATERFIVERSIDGDRFAPIGDVGAAGESLSTIDYMFDDIDPPSGLAYYRLMMQDLDGKAESSPVIALYRSGAVTNMSLSPNPANAQVTVFWSLDAGSLSVVDEMGRPTRTVRLEPQQRGVVLDVADLAAGHYTVVLIDRSGAVLDRLPLLKN
ncbi:MAG: FG-GAP repeat protein [Flavobacteriales bacterium]|nr:FG-GAP repeat protein [Flavobacteriales bacterium]